MGFRGSGVYGVVMQICTFLSQGIHIDNQCES